MREGFGALCDHRRESCQIHGTRWNDDQGRAGRMPADCATEPSVARVSNLRARTTAGLISMSTETGIQFKTQGRGGLAAVPDAGPELLILMHSESWAWYPSCGVYVGIWLPLGLGRRFIAVDGAISKGFGLGGGSRG